MKNEFTEVVNGMEIHYIFDEATGTYFPDLELPSQRELGRYGKMRAKFLRENCKGLYQAMLIKGTLNEHCAKAEDAAYERRDRMVKAIEG